MQNAVMRGLHVYKRFLSPLFPPACRYVPTCSEFAAEAVDRYGVWRGAWMALGRLLRCHPLARGGFDPVPLHHHESGMSDSVRHAALRCEDGRHIG
jgi:uncharacterized protein